MKKIIIVIIMTLSLLLHNHAEQKKLPQAGDVKDVLAKVSPAVVKVIAQCNKRFVTSGIAVAPDMIVTSSLVLQPDNCPMTVVSAKGDTQAAKVLGIDEFTGLAVLQLNKGTFAPLVIAKNAEIGEWIALVGLFYNSFPAIFQGGIDRISDGELQLSALVVPGSPGGAVVNRKGELIGILNGKAGYSLTSIAIPDLSGTNNIREIIVDGRKSTYSNFCTAVPAPLAIAMIDQLKRFGRVRHGWVGVTVTADESHIIVTDIEKGSPAEKAALCADDIIAEIDGKPVGGIDSFGPMIWTKQPGTIAKLKIYRNQQPKIISVKLADNRDRDETTILQSMDRFDPIIANNSAPRGDAPATPRYLGIEMVELTPELAKKFSVKENYGLLISQVYDRAAAKKAGLAVGDIIVRFNGAKTELPVKLLQQLNGMKDNDAATIEFYRDSKPLKVSVIPDKQALSGDDAVQQQWKRSIALLNKLQARYYQSNPTSKAEGDNRQKMEQEILTLEKAKQEAESKAEAMDRELRKTEEANAKVIKAFRDKYLRDFNRIRQEIERLREKIKKETGKSADEL